MVWQLPAPATSEAQAVSQADADATLVSPVKVIARRGAAEVPPEVEYGADAIDALGVNTIGEAIGRLNARAGGEGAPVVIINGLRMADPSIVGGFPPDAMVRLEVLPPNAGAIYGATSPGQRVVNVVLQRKFVSHDGSLSRTGPIRGGTATVSEGLSLGRIDNNNFSNGGVQASQTTSLRADERPDYAAAAEGSTLRPETRALSTNLAASRALGRVGASFNVNAQTQDSRSVVVSGGQAVANHTDADSLNLTTGLNGRLRGWNVRARLSGQAGWTRLSGLAPSRTTNQGGTVSLGFSRSFKILPAGPLQTDLSGQISQSRTDIATRIASTNYASRNSQVGANLSLPLLGRKQLGGRLGDLSLNLGANRIDTDVGHGDSLRAGLFWLTGRRLSLNGSWSRSDDAPPDAQRFAPLNVGDPRLVYDFRTGQSVEIIPTTGGNPDLRRSRRETTMVGVRVGPFFPWSLNANVNLTRSAGFNAIGGLPEPTAEVEAAFPGRFQRDAAGRLTAIDQRPINIQRSSSTGLATSLNVSIPLAAVKPGGRQGFPQAGLSHSLRLSDTTLIRTGLPRMDRLAGDAGGGARQAFSLFADVAMGQWRLNTQVSWTGGRRSRAASGRDGPNDLVIAPSASVSLSLGYDLAKRKPPPAGDAPVTSRRNRGLALSLDISNLFDTRTKARLGDGRPAPGYGRNDQDPIGRTLRVAMFGRF